MAKSSDCEAGSFIFLHEIIKIWTILVEAWIEIVFVVIGSEGGDLIFDEIFGFKNQATNSGDGDHNHAGSNNNNHNNLRQRKLPFFARTHGIILT